MKSKTSEFDFIESAVVLFAVIGFAYTLYSFLSFAWNDLSGLQIALAIFAWVILWEIIGAGFIFLYRIFTGRLVILQKLSNLLSKP